MSTDRELLLVAMDKAASLEAHANAREIELGRVYDEKRRLERQLRDVRRASESSDKADAPQGMPKQMVNQDMMCEAGPNRPVCVCPNCGSRH